MEIRILNEQELPKTLQLIEEVFMEVIAPTYKPEGVEEFHKFIEYDCIKSLHDKELIIFWGAFEDEKLKGTLAIRPDGHICLFFVRYDCQGQGIGRSLFQTMYDYCMNELMLDKITVNASLQAVDKYEHMGMRRIGGVNERNGIPSIPLEILK